jgi:hypothetical protein
MPSGPAGPLSAKSLELAPTQVMSEHVPIGQCGARPTSYALNSACNHDETSDALCHGGDLADLGDASGVRKIRLNDVHAACLLRKWSGQCTWIH